ncbi:MAG: hypothetical protein DRQ88_04170 [Epsilonproteobacteria bacterium]|nr:MAG: hypothetical protein DRQ89_00555 [Campylobacterota bacterium]RLA67096.1 MAG: hypothetical protein DRQ88_04170 [Campylobacterota bacterium]
MKRIILILTLVFAGQTLAQGTITFHGDSAFNLAQEITESDHFSCDLNPVKPVCTIKTKITFGKAGKVVFSGEVAKDLIQVENFDGLECRTFANDETYCQLDKKPEIYFDQGKFGDQIQKLR